MPILEMNSIMSDGETTPFQLYVGSETTLLANALMLFPISDTNEKRNFITAANVITNVAIMAAIGVVVALVIIVCVVTAFLQMLHGDITENRHTTKGSPIVAAVASLAHDNEKMTESFISKTLIGAGIALIDGDEKDPDIIPAQPIFGKCDPIQQKVHKVGKLVFPNAVEIGRGDPKEHLKNNLKINLF